MTDPYKVLGVSPNATEEQIKTAYREMAKKYHPDNYADNPLSDLAQEKMQEINQAYDTIMVQRKSQSNRNGSPDPGNGTYSSQFSDIRRMINLGRIAQAQELLDGVNVNRRDAEWYFLKGSVYYSRGWLDEALQNFQQAVTMDPHNSEYRATYNQLLWQRQTGQPRYGQTPYSRSGDCSCCDLCAAFYCASCCMDCMGGCF